ncbi:MAG: hypothetical protein R3F39_10450 [Myxococcota bacterium]
MSVGVAGRCALAALWAAVLCAPGLPASAHIGGFIVLPDFDAPLRIAVPTQPEIDLLWRDGNIDPTGVFHFSYQRDGLPATPNPDPALLVGVEFGTAAISDLTNALSWTLEDVPTGAWHIVAQAVDPPLCPAYRLAPTVVVVRRDAEPLPLGALFFAPYRTQIVTEDVAALDLRAVAESAPTVTMDYGVLDPIIEDPGPPLPCDSPPCPLDCPTVNRRFASRGVLLTDAAMEADPDAGAGWWRLSHVWDAVGVPEGNYELRAVVRAGPGEEVTIYSGAGVTVREPEQVAEPAPEAAPERDAGTDFSETAPEDLGAPGPDATEGQAEAEVEAPAVAESGGCSAGGGWGGLGPALAALFVAWTRRGLLRPGPGTAA